jgi:hypothetical protein
MDSCFYLIYDGQFLIEKSNFDDYKSKTNRFEDEINMKKIEEKTGKSKIIKENKKRELLKLEKGTFCGLEILYNSSGCYESTLTAMGDYNVIFKIDIENYSENKEKIINYLLKQYKKQKEILDRIIKNKITSDKKKTSIFKFKEEKIRVIKDLAKKKKTFDNEEKECYINGNN